MSKWVIVSADAPPVLCNDMFFPGSQRLSHDCGYEKCNGIRIQGCVESRSQVQDVLAKHIFLVFKNLNLNVLSALVPPFQEFKAVID